MRRWPRGQMAADRGLRAEVVVGEEVTTLGGHLLALFIDRPIRPYKSLRSTIAAVHDAGGLAIPAHPLVPYPLCAQGWVLRRLIDDPDATVHPDAIETFNPTSLGKPWHARVVRFADAHRLARVGNSDAHALEAIGSGWTTFPGRRAADLRRAIETRTTDHGGSFHATAGQLGTFGQQLRKREPRRSRRGPRPAPTGWHRSRPRLPGWPAAPAAGSSPRRSGPTRMTAPHEDRPRLSVHLPRVGRRRPARPVPVREPPGPRARRPDHHRQPRTPARVGRRHPPHRRRVQHAGQRVHGDADLLAALHRPGPRAARTRTVRPAPLPRAVRAVPVAVPVARVAQRQRRDVPRLRRVLAVVRARQPGDGWLRRPPPWPDRRQRGRAPLHRSVLPGRLQGHPERRRRAPVRRAPCRSPAGRTACPTCCSSGGSSRARASSTSSRRTASCAARGPATVC